MEHFILILPIDVFFDETALELYINEHKIKKELETIAERQGYDAAVEFLHDACETIEYNDMLICTYGVDNETLFMNDDGFCAVFEGL